MSEQFPRPRSLYRADDFTEGEGVVYTPQFGPREDGIVTSVGEDLVFVRYKATQVYGTATYPHDLFKAIKAGNTTVHEEFEHGGEPQQGELR